ncbi:MAG: hypothetical protein K5931_05585 [Lachnospiraceae bacterium]|nr:hypothetical protein [Lachnospiraceae bacterium]
MLTKIKNLILLVLISVLAGYLLLVLVYAIPQKSLILACANSVSVFENEELGERITGYPNSSVDVYTDGSMFNTALFDNEESPFRKAVACHQYGYKDKSPEQAFRAYFYEETPDYEADYTRYWHGFLVFLKPLLLFFNYSDIRVINALLQTGLLCLIIVLFSKRKLYMEMGALLITYLFLTPYTLGLCLQYSSVFYIGFTGLLLLTAFYEKIRDKGLFLELFALLGMLTSYMDLLTYPVFTLGIPLTGYVILYSFYERDKESFFEKPYIKVLCFSASWAFGYIGMWAGKWLISIPFYGMESLLDTFLQVKKRSVGNEEELISYFDTLGNNFFMYKNSIYILLLVLYLLCIFVLLMYNRHKKKAAFKPKLSVLLSYVIIMLIPFGWMLVTKEHAMVHSFMTHKNLTVSVFALLCLIKTPLSELLDSRKESGR